MGFFSNTAALPAEDTKLANVAEDKIATNQEARALPWCAGRARLGLTWLCDAQNKNATPVTSTYNAGKKKKSVVTGYLYSAQLAGLICHGLVDTLHEVWIDNVKAWSGTVTRSAAYASIDIPGQAAIRFYWGAQTSADSILAGHPAYVGQCYAVFDPLTFGQDRTGAPSVEFVLSRATAVPGLSNPTNSGDVCPVHALIELLCHPRYGIGLRVSDFDLTAVQTFSNAVTAAGIWCSPLVTKATNALQVAADLQGYFDGYIRMGAAGRYSFGSASIAVDHTSTPILDSAQLTDHPEVRSASYALTPSEVRLTYTDRDRDMKEAVAVASDTASLTIHGTGTPIQLQRSYVTRQSVAQTLVATAGLRAALPEVSLSVRALYNAAVALLPGDGVRVRPWHGASFLLKCRLTKKSLARSRDCEMALTLLLDPAELTAGTPAASYTPPADTDSAPANLVFPLLRTVPSALAPGAPGNKAVVLLGARSHSLHVGFDVYKSTDNTTYDLLATLDRFAATGTLTAPFGVTLGSAMWTGLCGFAFETSPGTWNSSLDHANGIFNLAPLSGLTWGDKIRFTIGTPSYGTGPYPQLQAGVDYFVVPIDVTFFDTNVSQGFRISPTSATDTAFTFIHPGNSNGTVYWQKVTAAPTTVDATMHAVDRLAFTSQTAGQADFDRLLCFMEAGEIMSVEGYTAVSGLVMRLANPRRGRWTTATQDHASGSRLWLIYASDLRALVHASFTTGATRYFKAPTQTAYAVQDVASVGALSLVV